MPDIFAPIREAIEIRVPRHHKVPVAIVGAGEIADLAHLPAYEAHGLEVLGIHDVDGAKARAVRAWRWPESTALTRGCGSARSQSQSLPSMVPKASKRLSGEKARAGISPSRACRTACSRGCPRVKSHRRTVPSTPPEASRSRSELNARETAQPA